MEDIRYGSVRKGRKIREKTGVSYEDAKSALEACNYDLLDAIVYLEKLERSRHRSWHLYDDSAGDIERAGTGTGCLRAVLQEENIR